MKKKLLSVLMVLCLILAMAPAAMAEGDGDTAYTEWTSTTSLPTTSGAYKLMDDVSMNSSVSYSGRSIVLDLNGHSITFTNATKNSAAFYFYNNSSLTLEDSVGDGKISNDNSCGNYLVYVSGGNFTMTGGIIENNNPGSGSAALYINAGSECIISGGTVVNTASDARALFVNSGSSVEFNSGEIKNTAVDGDALYVNGAGSGSSDTTTFVMNGGKVTQESTYASNAAIYANNGNGNNSIDINGGSVSSATMGIYAPSAPTKITAGSFDTDGYAFNIRYLNITPGSNDDLNVTSDKAIIYSFSNADIDISGGTFNAPYISTPYAGESTSNIQITDGIFNNLTSVKSSNTNSTITITSGTFTDSKGNGCMDVNNYIPDNMSMEVNPDTGAIVVDTENSLATVDDIGY